MTVESGTSNGRQDLIPDQANHDSSWVINSQIAAAKVDERTAAVSDQDIDDPTDDDTDAVALDRLLQLAVHRANGVLQHRGAGGELRPVRRFETRRAFQRALAAEQIRDCAGIAREKIDREVTGLEHRRQGRCSLVDG